MTPEELANLLDKIELEKTCPVCKGERFDKSDKTWINCRECDGNGTVVTAFGEKIIELIHGIT